MSPSDEVLKAEPIKTVYHYTSQTGLLGIVNSKSLWATNIAYLNDAREFYHAIDTAYKGTEAMLKESTKKLTENELKLLQHIKVHLQLAPMVSSIPDVYVFCLSEKEDLLTQWRAYCPRNGGFSIGFDCDYLEKLAKEQGFNLIKCDYAISTQPSLIDNLLSKYVMQTRKWTATGDNLENEIQNTFGEFVTELFFIAPRIKDQSFQEERDWRLSGFVPTFQEGIDFREGTSMITPYYKFKLAQDDQPVQIQEVIVGPTPHPHLARESAELFLQSMHVCNKDGIVPPLRLSLLPFCGW